MPAVSWRRILGGAALIAAGLGLLYLLRGTWPPFVLALVLTYLLAPAVDFLEAQGLRRATATSCSTCSSPWPLPWRWSTFCPGLWTS